VTAIALGGSHSCAIVNGGVQCWGYNYNGQLGNNSLVNSPTAVQAVLSGATAVAAGFSHSCAVICGAVQCWGDNVYGQLGIGTTKDSLVPVPAVASLATDVNCGSNHSCALVNGAVQCWGFNTTSELGNRGAANSNVPVVVTTLTTPVQTIAAGNGAVRGNSHTCALTNGSVRCWGYNNYGQLGIGTTTVSSTPAAAVVFQ
jgi:alpha-tubulin suppressor-like RCC1 family protein